MITSSSPFYSIKYFCCMKTKTRCISKVSNSFTFISYPKSMCCIINNL